MHQNTSGQSSSSFRATMEAVVAILFARITTHSVLVIEKQILLTDIADEILIGMRDDFRRKNDPGHFLVEVYRILLRRCRELGVEAGWQKLDGIFAEIIDQARRANDASAQSLLETYRTMLEVDPLMDTLLSWLDSTTPQEQRAFLETHMELLEPHCEALLDELIERFGGKEEEAHLRDSRQFLRRSREAGIEVGWREFLKTQATGSNYIPESLKPLLQEILALTRPEDQPRKVNGCVAKKKTDVLRWEKTKNKRSSV